jgi:hypothetical protein
VGSQRDAYSGTWQSATSGPVFAAITASFPDVLRVFYYGFAYSVLASFRMGMSGSAFFQRASAGWAAKTWGLDFRIARQTFHWAL